MNEVAMKEVSTSSSLLAENTLLFVFEPFKVVYKITIFPLPFTFLNK